MRYLRFILCFVPLALFATVSCADVITDWNNVALQVVRTDKTNPPAASRALAMLHAAMFDAVNSTDLTYSAYHSYQTAVPGSSAEAAAAAAARDVLVQLYPAHTADFDAALAGSIAGIPNGAAKTNGLALGHSTATDIVAWRANDNSALVMPYTPSNDTGKWRPTPPGNLPGLLPNWPYVTPFALASGSQFRGSGPPDLTTAEYAASYIETKDYGRFDSAFRNAYQTETAFFWADGAGTVTPPGHWNQIAQVVAQSQGNTLLQNARLFALLNISMADAAIAAWDNKYAYNLWRPITAIQLGDTDGNPLTAADVTWTPLLTTPNFPEHTSGHSTFSGAAAGILADFYGTNDIAFTVGSEATPGVFRTYTSFSEAADEAGKSRIYGGIHFEFSDLPAIATGEQIANFAFANNLQPVPDASTFVLAVMSGLCGLAGCRTRLRARSRQR